MNDEIVAASVSGDGHRPVLNASHLLWGRIAAFTATAIVLACCWAIYARNNGWLGKQQSAGLAAAIAQTSVLVAALAVMVTFARSALREVGWRIGSFRTYAAVFGIVVAVVAGFSAFAFAAGFVRFADQGLPTAAQLAISIPILLIMSCVFSFAEEFGWRGFVLPTLLPLGAKRALLVSGLIWFLWEAPLVHFGLLDSKMAAAHPAMALFLHLVQNVAVAISLGYLRLRFDSVFVPTFAHGVLNTLGGVSFMLLSETDPVWGDFGGPISTAILVVVAVIIWRAMDGTRFSGR